MDQKKLNEYNFSTSSDEIGAPSGQTNQIPKGKAKTIEEEIHFLTHLSMMVQEKNEKYKKIIEEKIKNKTGYHTIDEEFEYDFEKNQKGNSKNDIIKANNSKKLKKIFLILKNSAYHIYKLQLIQFAESIKRIYKNSKTNEFFITFDNTDEEIPPIILNQKDYNNLISIRDKYSNNDILSSFISKEDCVNPNSINNPKKNSKTLTPNKINKNGILVINQNNHAKSKDDTHINDTINKGNFYYLSSYNICHQCKLQKIDEDLIKCQYVHTVPHPQNQNNNNTNNNHNKLHNNNNKNSQSNINNENSINYFFIGQSAIILTNKIYYLKNYDDSVKELVDNYFAKLKENNKKCEKYYCKNCLRSIYDIDINEIRKKNFRCPACSNRCNCTRCIRYENLIKQIAYYLNNYGDMDKLYDYLIKQNSIFEKLKDYLVCSKFICFDFNTKNYTPLKLNIPYNKSSGNSANSENKNNKNNELNSLDLLKYKNNLEKMQIDFCNIFDEANLKKQLYDTEFFKLKENMIKDKESDKKSKKLIGHKIKKVNGKKK